MPIPKPKVKILAVDDREENLMSIEAILGETGYTLIKASSGKAALKVLLREEGITLILMDVQMPELNGFETAELIYARDKMKHIPIIFITANDRSEENQYKGYQLGGVDFIYKPINAALLRAKVAVFVELFYHKHEMLQQEQNLLEANKKLEAEVAERKLSEEQVRRLNSQLLEKVEQLKTSNEELERFAYVASHDLQEPLRKIRIFTDMFQAGYGNQMPAADRDKLARIIRASERMRLLIRNLLAFARAANDTGELVETDLSPVIKSILTDLEETIAAKKARVQVGTLPVLTVNPVLMRQVFQNLLVNALKFIPEDRQPEIRIGAEPVIREDNRPAAYRIWVQDNGIGFDMAYKDQIFVPFKRLQSQEQYEGAGIGLPICKKIVEKHQGRILVESQEGVGSTFSVILPA